MGDLFDNFDDMSDVESVELYGDSILEEFRSEAFNIDDILGSDNEKDFYSDCEEEECPLGPDTCEPMDEVDFESDDILRDPILRTRIPSPAPSAITLTPPSSIQPTLAFPIRPPPIRSPILPSTTSSSLLTTQAFEALISTVSLASTLSKGKKLNSIGARISALCLGDCGVSYTTILEKTGVSQSAYYKLHKKAISRGWREGEGVEVEHVTDAVVEDPQLLKRLLI